MGEEQVRSGRRGRGHWLTCRRGLLRVLGVACRPCAGHSPPSVAPSSPASPLLFPTVGACPCGRPVRAGPHLCARQRGRAIDAQGRAADGAERAAVSAGGQLRLRLRAAGHRGRGAAGGVGVAEAPRVHGRAAPVLRRQSPLPGAAAGSGGARTRAPSICWLPALQWPGFVTDPFVQPAVKSRVTGTRGTWCACVVPHCRRRHSPSTCRTAALPLFCTLHTLLHMQ